MTFKLKDEAGISQAKTGGCRVIPGRKNSRCIGFEEVKSLAYSHNGKSLI